MQVTVERLTIAISPDNLASFFRHPSARGHPRSGPN